MKLKNILSVLLALVICLTFTGCDFSMLLPESTVSGADLIVSSSDSSESSEISASSPLLYKATDSDGNTVWLFGSIHVGRNDFYPLPDYVMDAYENSDALAVEVDIIAFEKDFIGQMNALQKLIFTDGTTIRDYVPEDTYNKAAQILKENNLYNSALDYYMPSLWSNFIDNCAYMQLDVDMNSGIDRYLLETAKNSGKEILEIESAELQYGVLGGFSDKLQLFLLESSVEAYGEIELMGEDIDKMLDLWASGNEKEFAEYLSESEIEDEEEKRLYEEYNQGLITERNAKMTDYAEKALKSGKEIFICVGAAHVVGDGAIAQELKSRGYNVEAVN